MNHAARLSLVSAAVLLAPAVASAGLLDKLNEAAKKLNETSQQASQNAQQNQPGASGSGSLSAGLGATNLHGLTDYNGCMAQTSGAQEKLTAQVLQRKLAQSPNLSPQERHNIEEDIQWLNAKAAGGRAPAPDPKNSQRYLLELSDEEQREIAGANGWFANAVHEKCEAQYGGMSQFADPGGRRHAPIDTRVALPDLLHATPSARQPSALEQRKSCVGSMQGLRWQLMADKMESKLKTMPNLAAKERQAWEEDIAVVRSAEQSGATAMPQSPDPQNPLRYMTRLTPDDQMAMNQEYATASQQLLASCRGGASAAGAVPDSAAERQAQALAAMHAQRHARGNAEPVLAPNTAKAEAQAWLDAHPARAPKLNAPEVVGSGGSLSAGLGATRADYLERGGVLACYDRMKGFRATQTADRLTTKRASVPAQDHQELEVWVTAWRAAEQAGLDQPTPPSPGNPQGYLRFLTSADQQELNMADTALHDKVLSECNAMDHMEIGAKNSKVKFGD